MVRGDSKASALTRLVFCTYGVLLRRLQDDPSIGGIDYVILDEVHERGVDSDFALALLMSAMSKRQNLKIILMSATMSTDKFANYLGSSLRIGSPSPVLHIPGYTFPVEDYYKNSYEDIVRNIYIKGGEAVDEYGDEFDSYSDRIGGRQRKGDLDYDLMVRLIIALSNGSKIEDRNISASVPYHMLDKAEGSLLVFMPGVPEINRLISLLSSTWSRSSADSNRKLRIMPLHGNLSPNEQKKIFIPSSVNELKIVVSTNVAEASVTIPDVTVVVDCCRVKEIDFDIERQMSALIMKICAKDSLRQRRGRAGRVQKGRCFRLVTNGTFDKLQPHGVPEILRVPLERLILQIKAMRLNETCLQLLQRCPDCPEKKAILCAELMLIKLQALDNDGNLTSLGRSLSALPCDPSVGKLLIYGSLLGSVYHAAAVAACLTSRSPFISSTEESEQKRIEVAKMSFVGTGISSDHMIMAKAIQEFDKIKSNKRKYCNEKCLSFDRMLEIQQLQRDLLGDLVNIGFLKSLSNGLNLENSIENRNSDKPKLLAATLCAGLYPKIAKIIRYLFNILSFIFI
jgi:HrpA-like RNA helicase